MSTLASPDSPPTHARRADDYRRLASEIEEEVERVARTAVTITTSLDRLKRAKPEPLLIYGGVALVEGFHWGVQRVLLEIERFFDVVPGCSDGDDTPFGQRLLEGAVLDLPGVRPPILSRLAAQSLEPYLAFSRRYREHRLFELDADTTRELLCRNDVVWESVRGELERFALKMRTLAQLMETSD